jgi:hypothetical protein
MDANDALKLIQYQADSADQRVKLGEETPAGAHSSLVSIKREVTYLSGLSNNDEGRDPDATNDLLNDIIY